MSFRRNEAAHFLPIPLAETWSRQRRDMTILRTTPFTFINISRYIGVFLVLPVALLAFSGCGQLGRFVTSGEESQALATPVGCVDIVVGHERKSTDESDQNLLYLLIVTPGLRELGSGSSSDNAEYVTTLKDNWNTEKGSFAVAVSWDRKRDVVTIGSREFQRRAGNVFIVRSNPNGAVSGEQLPSLGTRTDASGLLQYVQQQRPNDKSISSIVLSQR